MLGPNAWQVPPTPGSPELVQFMPGRLHNAAIIASSAALGVNELFQKRTARSDGSSVIQLGNWPVIELFSIRIICSLLKVTWRSVAGIGHIATGKLRFPARLLLSKRSWTMTHVDRSRSSPYEVCGEQKWAPSGGSVSIS